MNNNKVIYDGQTIMDISDSTTSSNNLLQGEIGYSGNGDRVVGSVIAGHTIQNDTGTDMQRRDKLQFKGVYVEDNQANDVTKVDIVREFQSKAEIEALTGEEAKGFQYIDDDPYDAFPLLKMESGVVSISCTQANYNFNEDITFTVNFTNVPQVMVCIDGDGTVGGSTVSCRNITSTGVRVSAQTTKTDSPTIKVKWLAIGT